MYYAFSDISAYNNDIIKWIEYMDLFIYALLSSYERRNCVQKEQTGHTMAPVVID